MFTAGTYVFDNQMYNFKVIIGSDGEVLATLNAPKAMTLEDFFNTDNWTREE